MEVDIYVQNHTEKEQKETFTMEVKSDKTFSGLAKL